MEMLLRHGAEWMQGLVVLGVVVAVYVGWRCLSEALAWNQDTAESAMAGVDQANREIDALKTRVKTLEDSVARSRQRDAEKKQVRIANVA